MKTWIIAPRDPLIVRDGRPFDANPGARAKSLAFPFPSTTTGGVRTQIGLREGVFDNALVEEVKKVAVRGPLLVELDETGDVARWLLPAPADALLLDLNETNDDDEKRRIERRRLAPLRFPDGCTTNLPKNPEADAQLMPVGLPHPDLRKPAPRPPSFWYWEKYKDWLVEPVEAQQMLVTELGHSGPQAEQRMHVRIDAETLTSQESFLFLTSGLEFIHTSINEPFGIRLGLALGVDTQAAAGVAEPAPGMSPLGGERRLVSWQPSQAPWPQLPNGLKDKIVKNKACRLLLLAPAYFEAGYRPEWLLQPRYDVTPSLEALALPRPQVVSGWDFALDRPKPTRRVTPAGTVLFLKLEGSEPDIETWVDAMWMHCISDDEEQDQKDGFGLAVLGVWSGEPQDWKGL